MHSSVYATENLLFLALLRPVVMILAAWLGNQLLRRLGQPGAISEINPLDRSRDGANAG